VSLSSDLAVLVDPHFDELFSSGTVPGMAYGIVHHDALVYSRGLGAVDLSPNPDERIVPGPHTVFSIASMTKSFTAATLLSLRDEGLLDLDQRALAFVPELARGHAFNQLITLRQLLTMSAGFATDDPWGDRQQDLDPQLLSELLGVSVQPMWRPGNRFEYSNLGYAVLGRVIEAVTSTPYRDVVAARILQPLSLAHTAYDVSSLPGAEVATGYVRRADEWVVEPIAGYGAFAPMGGILSSVNDIARWVSTLLAAEATDRGAPPLRADSLREMQAGHRFVEAVSQPTFEGAPTAPVARHYGYGLFEELLPWGRSVSHSGGYPGYGSHMRWHVGSGLGIVALGNRTYAPMGKTAAAALGACVEAGIVERPAEPDPHPKLAPARKAVEQLINGWDDALVAEWFTQNVHQDEPWDVRRRSIDRLSENHGLLWPDPAEPPRVLGPAHTQWWLVGERGGRVKAELLLSTHTEPLIQWVSWTSVPEPSPALVAAAGQALHAVDPDAAVGATIAGDGAKKATFRATGPSGESEVEVEAGGDSRVRRAPRSVAGQ
jgi:CubicO group peptidase (beta-lactamase class C family)